LQKMISENNVEDNTELIRQLKHSAILRKDVNTLLELKTKYAGRIDSEEFTLDAMVDCNFLYTYYTDIYNKIKKDEMDISLLFESFNILEQIERGELDQHLGAYQFGSILKKIYVDSALKKAGKLDELHGTDTNTGEYRGPEVELSWAEWKKTQNKVKGSANKKKGKSK
jgi:hypothetical protein